MEHDDSDLLRTQKLFLQQVEFELRKVNRRVIHERVPDLNRQSFVRFAEFVAEARSRYLRAALSLSELPSDSAQSEQTLLLLKQEREMFEESRDAFAALERAIERGYVDIKS